MKKTYLKSSAKVNAKTLKNKLEEEAQDKHKIQTIRSREGEREEAVKKIK